MAELLLEFARTGDIEPVTAHTAAAWAARAGMSVPAVYDTVAMEIAKGFDSGQLNYEFCDCLMNRMWPQYILEMAPQANRERLPGDKLALPSFFHDVYECFDAGEYHRDPHNNDDPVAEHTVPMVRALLAGQTH